MKRILAVLLFLFMLLTPLGLISHAETEYIDPETGVSFTLPDGWKQRPFMKEREFLKIQFATEDGDNGALFQFGYSDVYTSMTAEEKRYTKRSDLSNEYFSPELFASLLGQAASDISKVKYSGIEYYCYALGNQHFYYRCENGYLYMFGYLVHDAGSPIGKKLQNQCEAIMKSITYPSLQAADSSNSKTTSSGYVSSNALSSSSKVSSYSRSYLHSPEHYLAVAFAAVVCFGIPYLIKQKKKKKTENRTENNNVFPFENKTISDSFQSESICEPSVFHNNEQVLQNEDATLENGIPKYCRKCGNRVLPDSVFCDRCGAKIEEK